MTIGIDEVGRGCLAGPLVAAAVGLESNITISGLADSKKLTAKKRAALVKVIESATNNIGVGWVWPEEINKIGLTEAVRLAMYRALKQINYYGHYIIIDGNINYLKNIPYNKMSSFKDDPCNVEAVVRADESVPAVSAASIVAKAARDAYMIQMSVEYPGYGFEKHVGYGTKQHLEALERHGVLPIHRVNYRPIRKLLAENE